VAKFRDIKALSKAPTVLTDTFNCGEKLAIASVAIGLECTSVIETDKMVRKFAKVPFVRKLIPLFYVLGAVVVLLDKNLRSQYYNIKVDGIDYSGEYIDINMGNVGTNGGKNVPNPYAVPDDGYLDAVFIRKMPLWRCIFEISRFTKGNFEKSPKHFFHLRFKELTATSDKPVRICVDGEPFYASNIKIKINPGTLKFAAPAEAKYHPRKKYIPEAVAHE
jgi:diacylglycerol kinase family enzyme